MDSFKKYTDYKTILSVNALIWCDGKVLLLKRADTKKIDPGIYSGIGGKVEPGESFYQAIVREIKEETGIEEIKSIRPYSITQHPFPPTKAEWVNVYFYVGIYRQVKINPTKEGEFYWLSPAEVVKLPTPIDIKEYIKILSKNDNAFILGFFEYDENGKLIGKEVRVL